MAIQIEDDETVWLIWLLANRRGLSMEEAVKVAVRKTLSSDAEVPSLWERLEPLHDRIAARGSTGLEANKSFYDSLNDE